MRNYVTRENVKMDTNIDYQAVKDIARMIAVSEGVEANDKIWNDNWEWFQKHNKVHASPAGTNLSRWHDLAVQIIGYFAQKGSFRSSVELDSMETLEVENEQLQAEIDVLEAQVENLTSEVNDLSNELRNALEDLELSEREVNRLTSELEETETELENLGVEFSQLEEELYQAQYASTKHATTEVVEAVEDLDRTEILNDIREAMGELRNASNGPGSFRIALITLPNAIDKLCDLLEE